MSKGIEDTFGMRSLEDALNDQKKQDEEEAATQLEEVDEEYDAFKLPENFDQALSLKIDAATKNVLGERLLSGEDTNEKLDDLYDTLMSHGETMAKLAVELDPTRAPRAFEVMNGIIKNAMDAVNSKRDHEIKTLRLILDQQKFEHEKNNSASTPTESGDAIVATMTMADMVRGFRKAMDEAPIAETRTDPSD